MRIEKSLSWIWLVSGALVAGAGCTADDSRRVTAMYATTSGESVGLRGLAIDRATYDDLVAALGAKPTEVAVTPDAPDGTVQVMFAPSSPLVATYLSDPASTPTVPPLTITFDDGSAEPVALLVPAVQKVREVAARGSSAPGAQAAGTLTITLEGAATVGGGVSVAAGDLNGDGHDAAASVFVIGTHVPGVAPEQRAAMGDGFVAPTGVSNARFATSESSLVLDELALGNPYLVGRWGSAGATMNLVVDIHTAGEPLTRFRIARATSAGKGGSSHVKVFDGATGQGLTGDAERAMFDSGYASFTSDALDLAARALQEYSDQASMSLAIAHWTSKRTQALADIIVGTGPGGAAGYEAMACAAALPTAMAVANGLDVGRDENASAAATVIEAATTITPKVGLVSGGSLAMQAHGAPSPTGDAELACAAVHQIASLPDSLLTGEGKAIRALSVELAAFDARRLEIDIADWITTVDALGVSPDEATWAAARTKADILVDALGSAATRTQARWALAATMLGR